VIRFRDRGVSPVSCNTYIKALNAFCRWLHEQGHLEQRLHLPPMKVPRRILKTLDSTVRSLLNFKPRTFRQWRVFTVSATILDTGCRIDKLLSARVSAVDLDSLLLTIRGKGDKESRPDIGLDSYDRLFPNQDTLPQGG